MHCLGYLGHVLHTCFYCGQHSGPPTKGAGAGTTGSTITIPAVRAPQRLEFNSSLLLSEESASRCPTAYASARNRAVRFVPPAAWDVKPRSCRSGHWTMRYTRPTRNNLNPWSAADGAGPFDLVPWRQRRGRVNLAHATGWDNVHGLPFRRPVKRPATTTTTTSDSSKSAGGRGRRLIRIRVVLSFQFQKRMRGGVQQRRSRLRNRGSRVRPNGANGQQQQQLPNGQRQVFVFDPKLFRLSADWLGYFSQRPAGVEELLAGMSRQVDAARGRQSAGAATDSDGPVATALRRFSIGGGADRMDYRTLFGKVSRMFFSGGGSGGDGAGSGGGTDRQVFKQVPCLQCRQRYERGSASSSGFP